MSNRGKIVFVVGPTASGKSALAMQIALQYQAEIICADSRTVFKGMDIGTAKPSPQDQRAVKHHLLDVAEPNQKFSAAMFKDLAQAAIKDINSRGKVAIVVGGSGLYVDALLFDFSFQGRADESLRGKLEALSLETLQALCRQSDLAIENQLNRRHLIRALETQSKSPTRENTPQLETIVVGIATERTELRARVIKRTETMFAQGVLEEARQLGLRYGWECEAMTASIYRILKPVLEGSKPLSFAIEAFIKSDLSLAKRQMTWFKRNPNIIWGDPPELMKKVAHFLN